MSLLVHLPLNGNLNNLGLSDIKASTIGTVAYTNAGKIGKAFISGGATQVSNGISLNTNFLNEFGTEASVAVWIKPLGNHVHYEGAILSSGDWNKSRWAFGVNQNNTKVDMLCGDYNQHVNCEIPVGEWTHLVCTFKNGYGELYKNGKYVGSRSGMPAFRSDATITCVGRESYAAGYFGFNGYINDLRIYNHALSLKEIKDISKALILHYTLNNGGIPIANPNMIQSYMYREEPWASQIVSSGEYDGMDAMLVSANGLYSKTAKGTTSLFPDVNFEAGKQYTISLWWRGDTRTDGKSTSWRVRFRYDDGTNGTILISPAYNITQWQYAHVISAEGKNVVGVTCSYGNAGTVYLSQFKVEEGIEATPYLPNENEYGISDRVVYDCSGYGNDGTIYDQLGN